MRNNRIAIPNTLIEIFKNSGFSLFLVGGAVRDIIMNNNVNDLDFTTDAKPEQMMNMATENVNVVPTGIDFGTVTFIIDNESFEVTTFRFDTSIGRKPSVSFDNCDIKSDLSRRDFTINAIAIDVIKASFNDMSNDTLINNVIDPFNGIQDIENKIIRTVNDPDDRFNEDSLRMIRAIRFASRFNFSIDFDTFNSIRKNHKMICKISKERIRDEIIKAAKFNNFAKFITELVNSKLTSQWIFPEINNLINLEQNDFHNEDAFNHTMTVITNIEKQNNNVNPIVKIAALFHDIGKFKTKTNIDNKIQFIGHENIGSDIAKLILKNLKFSNRDIDIITAMIDRHMSFKFITDAADNVKKSTIRRIIHKIKNINSTISTMDSDEFDNFINDLFILINADNTSHAKEFNMPNQINNIKNMITKIKAENDSLTINNIGCKINGHDIMNKFNIKPSKLIKEIINFAIEQTFENIDITKEELLDIINIQFFSTNNE